MDIDHEVIKMNEVGVAPIDEVGSEIDLRVQKWVQYCKDHGVDDWMELPPGLFYEMLRDFMENHLDGNEKKVHS